MKNSMSSFSGLALSRTEMKSVTGGCNVYVSMGVQPNGEILWMQKNDTSLTYAQAFNSATTTAMQGTRARFCCASC